MLLLVAVCFNGYRDPPPVFPSPGELGSPNLVAPLLLLRRLKNFFILSTVGRRLCGVCMGGGRGEEKRNEQPVVEMERVFWLRLRGVFEA